jgi:hypothetical protein
MMRRRGQGQKAGNMCGPFKPESQWWCCRRVERPSWLECDTTPNSIKELGTLAGWLQRLIPLEDCCVGAVIVYLIKV